MGVVVKMGEGSDLLGDACKLGGVEGVCEGCELLCEVEEFVGDLGPGEGLLRGRDRGR